MHTCMSQFSTDSRVVLGIGDEKTELEASNGFSTGPLVLLQLCPWVSALCVSPLGAGALPIQGGEFGFSPADAKALLTLQSNCSQGCGLHVGLGEGLVSLFLIFRACAAFEALSCLGVLKRMVEIQPS